jgi:hypothetical protein
MTDRDWRDLIVGDRMRVDQEFADTVRSSSLSSTEWSLVMTAVEFDVEGEGESARLVADTSQVESILPELEKLAERMGGMPGKRQSKGAGSILDTLRSSLNLGNGGPDPEKRNDALGLPQKYADALQRHLEERGKWSDVRERSAAEDQPSPE